MNSVASLTGRRALVTGGSRGLGAGIARALGREGAHVAVSARSSDDLAAVVAEEERLGHRALALPTDLAEQGAGIELVADASQALGGVDILVHAAGHLVRQPALEYDMEQWDAIIGVHLRMAFELSQAVARDLVARDQSGSIILIGSLTSARAGVPGTVAYAAAKSGLLGLMRALAVELAPYGIRVNTIAPGFFPTALTQDVQDTPERQTIHARIPMGRTGTTQDLDGTAVFLASDASAYITGEMITVDGGWSVA